MNQRRGKWRSSEATAARDPRPRRPRGKNRPRAAALTWGERLARAERMARREEEEGNQPSALELAEAAERESRRRIGMPPLRAAFYADIGEEPVCDRGTLEIARGRLAQIEQAIALGEGNLEWGAERAWTRAEKNRLYQLRAKWKLRAEGRDWYWRAVGNRKRKLEETDERRIEFWRGRVKIDEMARRILGERWKSRLLTE